VNAFGGATIPCAFTYGGNFMKRMKKLMLQCAALATLVVSTGGAGSFAASPTTIFAQSVRENFAAGNNGIPYRLAHFNADCGGEPFLFVFLHGNSASGTDNEKQLEKELPLFV